MTISAEMMRLFPVLSLDFYNRGYNNQLKDYLDDSEIFVNGAEILFSSTVLGGILDDDNSFYAVAYKVEGKIVIAFQGTDDPFGDAATGWQMGLGTGTNNQAVLALRFYNAVLAQGWAAADIVTTGHSLGGGLAGYVARLHGLKSMVFDTMAFDLAASNARNFALSNDPGAAEFRELVYGSNPVADVGGYVRQINVSGEALEVNRIFSEYDEDTALALGNVLITLPSGHMVDDVDLNLVERHQSQALLVIRNYLSA